MWTPVGHGINKILSTSCPTITKTQLKALPCCYPRLSILMTILLWHFQAPQSWTEYFAQTEYEIGFFKTRHIVLWNDISIRAHISMSLVFLIPYFLFPTLRINFSFASRRYFPRNHRGQNAEHKFYSPPVSQQQPGRKKRFIPPAMHFTFGIASDGNAHTV